ncbi:MAG: T9SS type A sorting domain-containing protein, partial [Flavobacteriales bacterium]
YPNWTLSPTLNITNAPFVPGLWRGTTSVDWFDCKNWDDIKVPIAITNVRIDETANQNCVVGLTPGGNANCASLIQTSSGAARNLIVQNTSSLAIGGPLTIQRTTAGAAISTTILGNSTLSTTALNVSAVALNQAIFRNEVPGNTVTISGNFNLGTGGYVDLQGVGVGGNIFIGGNYQNDGPTELTLDDLNGTITMNGSGAQSVVTSGFQEVFGNFTVAKSGGAVTLNSPLAVRGFLNLSSGLVNTSDPGGLLTLLNGSAWSNASDLSFVNGPMEKAGNTPFTFPVGKGSSLRPCGITGIVGTTTNSFIAEYIPVTAYSWGIIMEPTLHHLSQCEHWLIDRRAGTPTATVQLTWDTPESCGVTDLPDLRVARWDIANSIWRDRGNGGAAGTLLTGTIPTAAVQTNADFNTLPGPLPITAWTLGSITDENPLPIELISFTAKVEEPWVRLDWTTASERNNDFFTVERSADGEHFMDIHEEMGAGNSQQVLNYLTFDREPLTGLSYYRLRQTDFDGTSELSSIVTVYRGIGTERPLVVFGDAAQLTALHGFPVGSNYELMDMTGRLIISGSVLQEDRLQLSASGLQRGAYLFRLSDGQRAESVRFVY